MHRHLSGLAALAIAAAAPAAAQDVWDETGGVETEFAAEAGAVIAPDSEESALFTLRARFGADFVLDNGAEIGARFSGGVDKDNPARPAFSGIVGPPVPAAESPGAFAGLSRGPAVLDSGIRARAETAYIYIAGGYGELRAGLDEGVAARFHEGAPLLMRYATLVNPALDPSGAVIARTDHDLTGPSLKISYATPRLLGVRAGASFAPDAGTGGLDRNPAGPGAPDVENAAEFAVNVSRRLPRSGVRLRAAAAWSGADAALPAAPGRFDRVETWSGGGSVEFSSFALGASWLSSDNGFAAGPGDYNVLSAALRVTRGKYDAGLELSSAEDEALGAESDGFGVAIGRSFGERFRLVAGWQDIDTRFTGNPAPLPLRLSERTDGIVIEITLSR